MNSKGTDEPAHPHNLSRALASSIEEEAETSSPTRELHMYAYFTNRLDERGCSLVVSKGR